VLSQQTASGNAPKHIPRTDAIHTLIRQLVICIIGPVDLRRTPRAAARDAAIVATKENSSLSSAASVAQRHEGPTAFVRVAGHQIDKSTTLSDKSDCIGSLQLANPCENSLVKRALIVTEVLPRQPPKAPRMPLKPFAARSRYRPKAFTRATRPTNGYDAKPLPRSLAIVLRCKRLPEVRRLSPR
jgi:hypothetical protein